MAHIKSKILTQAEMELILHRMALEILEKNKCLKDLIVVGIKTRGIYLGQKIVTFIKEYKGVDVAFTALDITLYRDDLSQIAKKPVVKTTQLPIDIQGKNVILVDDVLYTGRTIRAAMDALFDIGRPATIRLAVLIDRGHKQIPIAANFTGKFIPTSKKEIIKVNMQASDGIEETWIIE
jgi:pyrimidine operon attenuation protein/uracil phosphoribosyltransferase